jgi:hypothetical protein
MTWPRSSSCERARFLAALAPDRILSETEEGTLARHLERCPSCSAFATSVAAFTSELRTAPLERPEAGVSLVLRGARRRPRTTLKLPLVGLAAAAAGVLVTSVALKERAVLTATTPTAPPAIVAQPGAPDDGAVLARLRAVVHARQLVPDYRSDRPGSPV